MDIEKKNDQNKEVRRQWDGKAAFWDQLMGADGNQVHRGLVSPAIEQLLALRPGEQVLDIACGTGVLARRLAELGGNVTGVDLSEGMLAQARAHDQVRGNEVTYLTVDATDEAALMAARHHRLLNLVDRDGMMAAAEVPLELKVADERDVLEGAVQSASREALEVDLEPGG